MQGTIIFGLIFAIIIAIFAIQNASIVALNLLMWKFEISLAVVVLGSIIFGALVIGIFSYFKQYQLRRKNKNLKLEIQSLKEELDKIKVEKRELEAYKVENTEIEDTKETYKEEPKEKRGFFGFKKKETKTEDKKEEKPVDDTKMDNKEENDIAYNLNEESDETKNNS
jgi:uncharacterized integral membrane protein